MRHLGKTQRVAAVLRRVLPAIAVQLQPLAGLADPVFNPANGHYYDLVTAPGGSVPYSAAVADAAARGCYLATLTSAAEGDFVYDNLVDVPAAWVSFPGFQVGPWLGGAQDVGAAEPFGGWRWTTGEAIPLPGQPGYQAWESGEPNQFQGRNEDVLGYFALGSLRDKTWADYLDTSNQAYVLECDAAPIPTLTPASSLPGCPDPDGAFALDNSACYAGGQAPGANDGVYYVFGTGGAPGTPGTVRCGVGAYALLTAVGRVDLQAAGTPDVLACDDAFTVKSLNLTQLTVQIPAGAKLGSPTLNLSNVSVSGGPGAQIRTCNANVTGGNADVAIEFTQAEIDCGASSTALFLRAFDAKMRGSLTVKDIHVGSIPVSPNASARLSFAGSTTVTGGITREPPLTGSVQLGVQGDLVVRENASIDLSGAGTLDVTGTLDNRNIVRVNSVTLRKPSTLLSLATPRLVLSSEISVVESFSHEIAVEADWSVQPDSVFAVLGGVGAALGEWAGWAEVEVASRDLGAIPAGFQNNFEMPTLRIGAGAQVVLRDALDNGNRAGGREALYADTVVLESPEARINLNGHRLYYNTLVGNASQIIDVAIPPACGNGVRESGEFCDDGNLLSGDSCSMSCRVEGVLELAGAALGGSVTITIEGIEVTATTAAGNSVDTVLTALAAAVTAQPALAAAGITASVEAGRLVVLNASLGGVRIDDQGLGEPLADPPPAAAVPMPPAALLLLAITLMLAAARARPRRA